MKANGVAAGIVSYNPDAERLRENLQSVCTQVDRVLVVDNGSCDPEPVRQLVKALDNVELIENETNLGIAAALNQIMSWAFQSCYSWALTLDQDSLCERDMVQHLLEGAGDPNAAILTPAIQDRNVGMLVPRSGALIEEVRLCITSGALARTAVWSEVHGYDEKMFIDSVDFDYCYRVRKTGRRILRVNQASLLHELGHAELRRFLVWRVRVNNHSAFRKYYIARNMLYCARKNRLPLHFLRANLRIVGLAACVLLYEDDKCAKLRSIGRGFVDGYRIQCVAVAAGESERSKADRTLINND